ncbi:DUF427 domain-containing protein [Cesiribacter andamanensis]|uniref:DUF427 domain-containing protein n=1 Tax=Cesiribacter andamanensis AMV16 TaxID=1279009 RepID=M7NJC3_9BACT|nr:DUF427 domain-containing protein [Cesiribacter andamanensis]EMR01880.1 hypothetical protein ADICEAN_02982 [Cesiribacter andamanensis AMV16]
MKAIWNNTIIADSNDIVEVEGNAYFPASAVKQEYLVESPTTSTCPWKGTARYYSLQVEGAENKDAAWYYPEPSQEAASIRGRVAFWKGVEIKE